MRFTIALLLAAPLLAQHDMSHMDHGMAGMDMSGMPGMSDTSEPMQASGTSMNPADAPMNMIHVQAGRWTLMFHGVAFFSEIQQTGPRGADKFAGMNWFMTEASHKAGAGTFSVRSMLSLDPATVTQRRYPELFQTGETAYGKPIIDGQHPHDLFMELALEYQRPVGDKGRVWIYAAPVGDPALGPVAFPHRVSAAELPQATLGHHLEDSTHISNEVVTVGAGHGMFGLEASGFHGAEPNENRWNIDHGAIDSWSGRFTVAPNSRWSGQISAGRLAHPEALEPGDQFRTTASVTYVRPYARGHWATSLIWGRVHKIESGANLNGYGLESVARFHERDYVTGRIELVDKDELFDEGNPLAGRTFRIGAYTAGYTHDFYWLPRIATGLGANFTLYSMPDPVHAYYGQHPVAAMTFLRFRLR
ncbi:MAG TPA: hypothetical protein VHB50_07935 [Bryobacteraceae bacterium]|nr:hypothetical protein [Bryobacteraceae bacterium]